MKLFSTILCLVLIVSTARAVEPPEREYWVAGGLGSAAQYRVGSGIFSPHQRMNGFAVNLGIYGGFGSNVFGIRIAENYYPEGYPDVPPPYDPLSLHFVPTEPLDRIGDLGILAGRRWGSGRYIATLLGGIGIASSSRVVGYDRPAGGGDDPHIERKRSAALLFGADIMIVRNFYSSPQIGIFVDVNPDRPYWCIFLGLCFGDFADRVGR